MSVISVNQSNFSSVAQHSGKPVLLDFWAPWCGPCRMMAPVLHELAEAYEGRVKMVKVNVDEAQSLAVSCGVSSIPTLAYFEGGRMKGVSVGFVPREDLERKLRANLDREVRNSTAYTMATIFNCIAESESDLLVDPELNRMSAPTGRW